MVFPCRMIVLMGVVTVFNSILVASVFAVMVVSMLSNLTTQIKFNGIIIYCREIEVLVLWGPTYIHVWLHQTFLYSNY